MNPNDNAAVKRLLGVFAERPTEVLDGEAHAKRRARVVSHVQMVLRAPSPEPLALWRRVRFTEVTAILALAAAFALVIGHYWPQGEQLTAVAALRTLASHGDVLCDRNDGKSFTPCDPKEAADLIGLKTLANASVTVETKIGVRLALEPASILLVTTPTQSPQSSQVTLAYGRVDVTVPKLGPNRQFSVVTPNTTVTVHGTAFTVSVQRTRQQDYRTCVELREGVISVDSGGHVERLTAPARFGCEDTAAVNGATELEAPIIPPKTTAPALPSVAPEPARPRSTLALETRLLQTALGAERKRDFVSAEKRLRSLLSTYPNSVVAPEARAALERITAQNRAKP